MRDKKLLIGTTTLGRVRRGRAGDVDVLRAIGAR
jgi:hypothetical protein